MEMGFPHLNPVKHTWAHGSVTVCQTWMSALTESADVLVTFVMNFFEKLGDDFDGQLIWTSGGD